MTEPSCRLPWSKDSSSSLAKSSRDGADDGAVAAAVAMKSPDGATGGSCCDPSRPFGPKAPQTFDCRRTAFVGGGPARSTERSGRCSSRGAAASRRLETGASMQRGATGAPHPVRAASTMSMAARTAASIAKCGGPGKGSVAHELSGSEHRYCRPSPLSSPGLTGRRQGRGVAHSPNGEQRLIYRTA